VGVSCHEDMFVLVCDIDCLDEDEQLPDDDDDDALEVDALLAPRRTIRSSGPVS